MSIFNEYLIYINIYIEQINERINKFVFIKIGDKKWLTRRIS